MGYLQRPSGEARLQATALHKALSLISSDLLLSLTGSCLHGHMQAIHFSLPDPDLARATRTGHLVLFSIASLLVLPAAVVFFVVGAALTDGILGSISGEDALLLLTAAIPSFSGTLAWIALGLLLTKPTYPRWHLKCWKFVLAFGISAIPCCLFWLPRAFGMAGSLEWITGFALLAAIAAIAVANRNLRLARESLARGGDFSAVPVS